MIATDMSTDALDLARENCTLLKNPPQESSVFLL